MNRAPDSAAAWDGTGSVGSSSTGSASKRRRIGLACSACRARKSRCDGTRPKCLACDELGYDCIYVQSASSTNMIVGKEYLTGLENRLRFVEEEIISLRNNMPPRHVRFEDEQTGIPLEHTPNNLNNRCDDLEVNREDVHDSMAPEDVTDGMGAVVFSAEEDLGFFGPSSNIAFTRQISHAITQVAGNGQAGMEAGVALSQFRDGIMSISRPASPVEPSVSHRDGSATDTVNIYALPSERESEELISYYFATTGRLFPYLHEQTFRETYQEVRQNRFTKVRRTWLGLFNMVLALAKSTSAKCDTSAGRRVHGSDVYYQRAAGLCEKQILRATCLEAVQLLLIMGQYLQGTQKSVQAWTIHGLTVKAAFQLGLHSSVASKRFSLLEQEFRKRTWYGCVCLDRTLSMTFGRPASIPDEYVRIELPKLLDDGIPPTNCRDNTEIDSVLFFNSSITLYKVMWNVISIMYGGNIGCDGHIPVLDTISHLFKLEQQLADWQRALPPQLFLRSIQDIPDDNSNPSEKFRIVLTLRYHNLRILLHRSMLVRFLEIIAEGDTESQELVILQQIGSNSLSICFQSSMDIIAIISTIIQSGDSRRGMLGAWWFTLYYMFNAGLVLCGTWLVYQHPNINVTSTIIDMQTFRASIVDAVEALQLLDTENPTIRTCAKYLGQLANVLNHISSRLRPTSEFDMTDNIIPNFNGDRIPASAIRQPEGMNVSNMPLFGISPLGMNIELGEFILDTDLEFLNQITLPLAS